MIVEFICICQKKNVPLRVFYVICGNDLKESYEAKKYIIIVCVSGMYVCIRRSHDGYNAEL